MSVTPIFFRLFSCLLAFFMAWFPVASQAMSIGEERTTGRKLLYSVRGQFDILDDPDIHQYINRLGQSVVAVAGPQFFDYHFFVIKSSQFNAFAAPAGLVFFYTGLISKMETEDELLSVLAHEIGHVVSRHISQRVSKSGAINATSVLLGLAGLALGIPSLSQGILIGSMAAGQAVQLKYSRNDEEQADRLSFTWLQKLRRNPVAMEKMLRTMLRISRYRSEKLPQYMLTHPNPETRLDYVQSLLADDKHQLEKKYYKPANNFSFLRFKYRILQLAGDYEQMRMYCMHELASSKDYEERTMAHFGLSLLLRDDHDYEGALAHLLKVQKVYPKNDILKVDEAVIRYRNNEDAQAVHLLDSVLEKNPDDVYALYERAKIAYRQKDYIVAEELFLRVARYLPEYAQLFYEMGRLYATLNKKVTSKFYLGKFYLYKGKIKTGRQYLERTVKAEGAPEKVKKQAQTILDELKELTK